MVCVFRDVVVLVDIVHLELVVLVDIVHLELRQTVVSYRSARSDSCGFLIEIPNCLVVQSPLPMLELDMVELLMTIPRARCSPWVEMA